MLSEAVHARARRALEVLMNLRSPSSKFAWFVRELEAAGAAHIFDGALGQANRKSTSRRFRAGRAGLLRR
jgi:mitochondrial fission protein ELM1